MYSVITPNPDSPLDTFIISKDTFRMILPKFNLPGLNQQDPRIFDYDETIGGIKLKVFHEADKEQRNYSIINTADIRFGKQKTFTTNEAVTVVADSSSPSPAQPQP